MPQLLINSAALLSALKQASALIVNNPVVPILENVLLTVADGQVTVAASNMEADLTLRVPCDTLPMDVFAICLPAKLLLTTLSNLANQAITLDVDLTTLRAIIKAGKGRYQLACENAKDWPRPAVKTTSGFVVDGALLAAGLQATTPFASTDNLRPEICAVNLEVRSLGKHTPTLRVTCTDGFRLAWHDFASAAADLNGINPASYLVPAAVARLLSSLCAKSGPVLLEVGAWLKARPANKEAATWRLDCRLVDARYPEYENVIPISNPNNLLVDRVGLQQVVRRLAAFANDKTQQLGLQLAEGVPMRLFSEDIDASKEADEELDITAYTGEEMSIGFNAKMMLDCLNVLPDGEINLSLSTPNRAAIFAAASLEKDQSATQVLLMPIFLNSIAA